MAPAPLLLLYLPTLCAACMHACRQVEGLRAACARVALAPAWLHALAAAGHGGAPEEDASAYAPVGDVGHRVCASHASDGAAVEPYLAAAHAARQAGAQVP